MYNKAVILNKGNFYVLTWQPSERGLPKDHPTNIWFNCVKWYLRWFKCNFCWSKYAKLWLWV